MGSWGAGAGASGREVEPGGGEQAGVGPGGPVSLGSCFLSIINRASEALLFAAVLCVEQMRKWAQLSPAAEGQVTGILRGVWWIPRTLWVFTGRPGSQDVSTFRSPGLPAQGSLSPAGHTPARQGSDCPHVIQTDLGWTHGTPWEPDLSQESIYLVVPIWSCSNGGEGL